MSKAEKTVTWLSRKVGLDPGQDTDFRSGCCGWK